MEKTVKCQLCGGAVLHSEVIKYKGKNFHKDCSKQYKDREELCNYICKVFNLKAPGPRNYQLMKRYREENNYTYKGMLNSLKYFFEVKKNDIKKSCERIGIIPYVYDEAQNYYNKIDKKKEVMLRALEVNQTSNNIEVKVSTRPQKKKKKLYSLEDFIGDNE
jgi:hypothetical protein